MLAFPPPFLTVPFEKSVLLFPLPSTFLNGSDDFTFTALLHLMCRSWASSLSSFVNSKVFSLSGGLPATVDPPRACEKEIRLIQRMSGNTTAPTNLMRLWVFNCVCRVVMLEPPKQEGIFRTCDRSYASAWPIGFNPWVVGLVQEGKS